VYVPTPNMLEKMEGWGYGTCTDLYQWGRGCDLKVFNPERRSYQFRESKGNSLFCFVLFCKVLHSYGTLIILLSLITLLLNPHYMCLGMSETDIVIIWVGRLVPEKRPDIWLNTVKRYVSLYIISLVFQD
jgi:glycosyltransferase involved in cell wall biosynthesis